MRRSSATAVDSFGRLDAVVSNAGIFNSIAFDELTPDDWRRMLGVHLDGGFYLAQPAYRVMKAQGYGRFVFISSRQGMFGQHLEAHYAAAKAGLVGLTNVIALEGAHTESSPTPCCRPASHGWSPKRVGDTESS